MVTGDLIPAIHGLKKTVVLKWQQYWVGSTPHLLAWKLWQDVLKRLRSTKLQGQTTSCLCTLKYCAEQKGGVFQILKILIPMKHSTIIPTPKKISPGVLNDLRPVALTSLVMEAFERIWRSYITKS